MVRRHSSPNGQLTDAVEGALPKVDAVIKKTKSITGVGEIVGPTLDSLMSKFKALK